MRRHPDTLRGGGRRGRARGGGRGGERGREAGRGAEEAAHRIAGVVGGSRIGTAHHEVVPEVLLVAHQRCCS
ncbi:hypothetical protein DUI70_3332 [Streptomyces albus]|nr:hypothetical protein DUI70_3332 [Streptomyces albus]